ncbi:hypothetical protein SG35_009690 [Thalassomonas actiniarum]|uniref:Phage tail assembly chaperone-like domain-containing protein n=2 Tax=Thalassomonas actiniarum TaxID=485447 RepID=A0AAF0C6A6_9GAMM|nr:hypothetical protein SG35_009690 [Thalassomonas actiniarum]
MAFLSEILQEEINPDLIKLQCENFEQVRICREPLLAEADCLINKALDIGADTAEYRTYRQALRDITSVYNDAKTVIWPSKPM